MPGTALGVRLRDLRNASGLTLRKVEELSDGRVKNGYLSQVESGAIKVPSTRALAELARIYQVDFDHLLHLADLPTSAGADQLSATPIAAFPVAALEDLNETETDQVLRFVAFVKSQRRPPAQQA